MGRARGRYVYKKTRVYPPWCVLAHSRDTNPSDLLSKPKYFNIQLLLFLALLVYVTKKDATISLVQCCDHAHPSIIYLCMH